jgi:hypothetical protein
MRVSQVGLGQEGRLNRAILRRQRQLECHRGDVARAYYGPTTSHGCTFPVIETVGRTRSEVKSGARSSLTVQVRSFTAPEKTGTSPPEIENSNGQQCSVTELRLVACASSLLGSPSH